MNNLVIKVCGLRENSNMLAVDLLQPDFLGMIFYRKSPRFAGTYSSSDTVTPKVGVFVNSTIKYILEQCEIYNLKHIQLHGAEDLRFVKELYHYGFGVFKTFSIDTELDHALMEPFEPYCSHFLLDTKGTNPGGNGKKFNWDVLTNYLHETPFLLSGGIGPQDLEEIKSISHPSFSGIDVNSRFETKPGIKNIEQLKIFIDEFRSEQA